MCHLSNNISACRSDSRNRGAKGFAFLAVEDPAGMVNVVIAPDRYVHDRAALQGVFVMIEGRATRRARCAPANLAAEATFEAPERRPLHRRQRYAVSRRLRSSPDSEIDRPPVLALKSVPAG